MTATVSHLDRTPTAPDPRFLKSRITNDPGIYPGLKENSAEGRRYRDLVNAYIDALGGIKHIPETLMGVLRELARLRVKAEQLGANGEAVSITEMCQLASTILRLSLRLGFSRREPEQPDLQDRLRYLAANPTPFVDKPEPEDAERDHA